MSKQHNQGHCKTYQRMYFTWLSKRFLCHSGIPILTSCKSIETKSSAEKKHRNFSRLASTSGKRQVTLTQAIKSNKRAVLGTFVSNMTSQSQPTKGSGALVWNMFRRFHILGTRKRPCHRSRRTKQLGLTKCSEHQSGKFCKRSDHQASKYYLKV